MSAKIYVGNLSWNTTEQTLNDVFGQYGAVLDSIVMRDRETGRSRGFGFVTYASEAEATGAIATANDQELDGRRIKVNLANARGSGGGGGGMGGPGGYPPQGGFPGQLGVGPGFPGGGFPGGGYGGGAPYGGFGGYQPPPGNAGGFGGMPPLAYRIHHADILSSRLQSSRTGLRRPTRPIPSPARWR
ncbi:hypothetical protein BDV93DRAFT_537161, partial [Ceratobasidium sp. AG-I]